MQGDAEFLQGLGDLFAAQLRPPERVSLPDWCDTHVQLPREGTAEYGQYRTARTPYVEEIARCLDADSGVSEVVWMAASQVGKSQLMNNFVCHTVVADPANIIVMQPTKELAEAYSTMRIDPMIRCNPMMARAIRDHGKSRAGGDRTLLKSFAGGFLRFVGANAPGDLASMPIPRVCVDELDRCSASAGNEGDPVELLRKRTSTFPQSKMLIVSSPGAAPSKIAERYADGDQCKLWVPCPHCDEYQVLRWGSKDRPGGVVWPAGHPELAQYQCDHCGALIDEGYKTEMLRRGQCRAGAVAKVPGLRSFHTSALYSPVGWYSWADAAREFVLAGKDPQKLQVFVNTVLAEVWTDEHMVEVSGNDIYDARERWPAEVPDAVQVLTAACDVQGDRLEYQVMGFGVGEESWVISHIRLYGDPTLPEVWAQLDDQIARSYEKQDGKRMIAKVVLVDSSDGNVTQQVYGYCSRRQSRNVYAIKGSSKPNTPTWTQKISYTSKGAVYVVGVTTGKDAIYPRIKRIGGVGPGMIHLPVADWCDLEYCDQLTAEIPSEKRLRTGRVLREWVKTRERNEAFDLTNYCLIGLHCLVAKGYRSLAGSATPKPPTRHTEPATQPTTQPVAQQPDRVHPVRRGGTVRPRTIGVY
jgi:phage terminase large subunit GpA-like protein